MRGIAAVYHEFVPLWKNLSATHAMNSSPGDRNGLAAQTALELVNNLARSCLQLASYQMISEVKEHIA